MRKLEKEIKIRINNKQTIYKLAFYIIKAIRTRPVKTHITNEEIRINIALNETAMQIIEMLTPRELLNIFPLDKTYSGLKYESKDYFYSMKKINEYGMDKQIKGSIDFLWDYMNIDIRIFVINILHDLDFLRLLNGKKTVMAEFAESHGIRTMKKYKDDEGKEYFVDNNGKVFRAKKSYPKYLKIIK